ncbi:MAG TPA: MBL fold metallo-hydrolase [Lacibacter sp.]|nr:MBL fold metallo-hydrolase [Lacibacter sp.]HMO88053.1 MBL fold metallo-hydrolase [Lacibacter sp.]HMP86164.1 MBL fold metallo-hydrolase [Lacibacter sp.]
MYTVKAFTFSPVQENTYVLYNDAGTAVLIDPGCYFETEREQLATFLQQNGLTPRLLLNTHCHLDHVFGNKWVAETYGLTLHLHPLEEEVLAWAPASGLMWNLPFDNYTGPFRYLADGQMLGVGDDALEVILAPGHSPGHVCFYSPAGGFVVGGDVLFRESIGRTDLPGGDYNTLLQSIRTRLFTLPGETIVYSGHGPATTIAHEQQHNPFLR